MIYLITGVPGSGKSLRTVQMILDWKKQGRVVYADIDGLNIDGVLPSPNDWRDTPEGSVVVYDECQKIFPSTGKAGVAEDERLRAMETHRHTGHDLVFITQAPTFVHHHIRKLVGKHIHCYRSLGLQGCTIYSWDGVCDNPNGFHEKKAADTERWTYPKDLFQYYKSATVHTHKFKIPKKLIFIFSVLAVLVVVSYFLISSSSLPRVLGLTDELPQTTTQPENGGLPPSGEFINSNYHQIDIAKSVTVSIMGCVSGKFCRCFGQDGNILDLAETMCRDLSEGNIALPIKIPVDESRKSEPPKS
jgi:zona occludens toxin (predicted ATPase)